MALTDQGWRIATVWECALKGRTRMDFEDVMTTLVAWLRSGEPTKLEITGDETPVPPT